MMILPRRDSTSRLWIILAAVLTVAFFSYNNNILRVASTEWFESHQIDSEQLVLDGLLRQQLVEGSVWMGTYSRPENENRVALARKLYESADTSGQFVRYKSQYGLQMKAFGALANLGLREIWQLQAIAAFLMSLVVAFLFWRVWVDFSLVPAIAFAAVLVLSPWVVVFARNLYWVTATWFIPLAVAMYYSKSIYEQSRAMVFMAGLLFVAYLLKFLCGYEYLTAIFVSACVPILYQGLRQNITYRKIAAKLFVNSLVLTLAFIVAIVMHARSIAEDGESGWSYIVLTAQKRIASPNPEETARGVCDGNTDCEIDMNASLVSNAFVVTAKYFLFKDFLPLGLLEVTQQEKEKLKLLLPKRDFASLKQATARIFSSGDVRLIVVGLSIAIGPIAFLLLCIVSVGRLARADRALRGAVCLAFIAPIGWFFLAKGHSYVHYHMNYVLWYLPFVPYCVVAMMTKSRVKESLQPEHQADQCIGQPSTVSIS